MKQFLLQTKKERKIVFCCRQRIYQLQKKKNVRNKVIKIKFQIKRNSSYFVCNSYDYLALANDRIQPIFFFLFYRPSEEFVWIRSSGSLKQTCLVQKESNLYGRCSYCNHSHCVRRFVFVTLNATN